MYLNCVYVRVRRPLFSFEVRIGLGFYVWVCSGDDGFGDVPLDPHSPEMMRDVATLEPDYGADSVSLAPEGRDYSIADGDYTSVRSEVPTVPAGTTEALK